MSSGDGDLVAISSRFLRAKREKSYQLYHRIDDRFEVMDGHGKTLIYGLDPEAQERSGAYIFRWWLSEIRDPAGGSVRFYYRKFEGQGSYLSKILFIDGKQDESPIVSYAFELSYQDLGYRRTSWRHGVEQIYSHFLKQVSGFWVGGDLSESQIVTSTLATTQDDKRLFSANFVYIQPTGDLRPLLQKIEYFGRTDTSIDKNPTYSFQYAPACPSVACSQTIKLNRQYIVPGTTPFTLSNMRWMDINGDGLADSISQNDDLKWSVRLNSSFAPDDETISFAAPKQIPHTFRDFDSKFNAIIDVDGDRRVDLLRQDDTDGTAYAFINSAQEEGFWAMKGIEVPGLPKRTMLGDRTRGAWVDLNADGKTDYVLYNDEGAIYVAAFYNRSIDGSIKFEATGKLDITPIRASPATLAWVDINADQLPDLVRFIPTDEGFGRLIIYGNQGGNSFAPPYSVTLPGYRGTKVPRFADVNGDGLPDAVTGSEALPIGIYLNNGSGEWAREASPLDLQGIERIVGFDIGDINGNGSADFIISTIGRKVHVYDPYLGLKTKAPFLLENVRTDNGLEERFSYQSSAKGDKYRADSMPTTLQVLQRYEQIAASFNASGSFQMRRMKLRDLTFKLPSYDFSQNEFIGFKEVSTTDYQDLDTTPMPMRGRQSLRSYYTSEQEGYLKGIIRSRVESGLSQSQKLSSEQFDYSSRSLFSNLPVRAIFLRSLEKTSFEGSKSVMESSTFCTMMRFPEMVPQKKTVTRFINKKPLSTVVSEFAFKAENWFHKKPSRLILIDPLPGSAGDKVLVDKKMQYNTEICRLEKVEQLTESGNYDVKAVITYDNYGNIKDSTDARGFKTTLEYTEPGHFLPTKFQQQVNADFQVEQEASYDYVAGGQINSLTDENGNETTINYDGLGRVESQKSPLNTGNSPDIKIEYAWGTTATPTSVRMFTNGVSKPSVILYNGLLQKVSELIPAEGAYLLKSFEVRDGLGLTTAMSTRSTLPSYNTLPFIIPSESIGFQSYDERGRLVKGDYPAPQGQRRSVTNAFAIEGEYQVTTSTNSANEILRTYTDTAGRMIRSLSGTQQPFELAYRYDAANRVVELSSSAEKGRVYQWGLNGQIREIKSPRLGTHTFEYNKADQVIAKLVTDAEGSPVETRLFTYDGLKRPTEERILRGQALSFDEAFPKAKINYLMTYDQASGSGINQTNLKGQLASLRVFPGATYHYSYDVNRNKILDHLELYDKAWDMTYAYDESGRLVNLQYPDASSFQQSYSEEHGALASIEGIASSIRYNNYLDLVEIKSQELTEARQYDTATGVLIEKTLKGPSLNISRRQESFDSLGRVLGSTGSDGVYGSIQHTHAYDELGRLDQSTLSYTKSPIKAVDLQKTIDYAYDAEGNLTRGEFGPLVRKNLGTRSNLSMANDPGQVWNFDANGRLTSVPAGRELIWASVDKVACFVKGTGPSVRAEQLPDGSRFTEVRKDAGGTHSTLFFNKYAHFDKEKAQWTRYSYIENTPFFVESDRESRYVFRDPLGTAALEVKDDAIGPYSISYPFGSYATEINP